MTTADLYESATLHVVSTRTDEKRFADSGVDLVTFEPLSARSSPRLAFGAAFARKHGLNALHVLPSDNTWYQYANLDECLAIIRRYVGPGAIVTGASMGGYAAVTFADKIGASRSMAMMPQFSIRRDLVPFERRWALQASRIGFLPWDGQIAQRCRHYVFYDPQNDDRLHAELIAANAPSVALVPVPGGSHSIAKVLAEAGCLSELALKILHGTPSAVELGAMIAGNVTRSPQYYLNRAYGRPLAESEAPLRAGLALAPDHFWLRVALGHCLVAQRRPQEALEYLVPALRRRPGRHRIVQPYLAACTLAGIAPDPMLLTTPDEAESETEGESPVVANSGPPTVRDSAHPAATS